MELSDKMELSRLSGRLYGDSGRLCGTTLTTQTTAPAREPRVRLNGSLSVHLRTKK